MSKYYTCEKILSYNRIFNFVIGNRSAGKSYTFKRKCIKNFINKGEKFIYVRRYQIDIDNTAPVYFDDMYQEFPDYQFAYKKGEFYINGEVAGYAIAVSMFLKCKSVAYPDVSMIVFDEFINEARDYIGGKDNPYLEPELCLNFYQSVARGYGKPIRENVKFVFISNSVSIVNPYFVYFNIDKYLKEDTKFIKTDSWVLEQVTQTEIQEEIKKSQFGKLIANTKYGSYAIDNKYYLDTDEFIEDAPKNSWYMCTVIYDNKEYALYKDRPNNIYYMNERVDKYCKLVYSLDSASHGASTRLVNRSSDFFKNLRACFENGQVRFANQRCKNALMMFLNY